MFCHRCGVKVVEDANYCSNCGVSLKEEEPTLLERNRKSTTSRRKRMVPFFLPILTAIVVFASIFAYYSYEKKVNAQVLAWKETSESLALDGDYDRAKTYLKDALEKRPNYFVLRNNLEVVTIVEEYEEELQKVASLLEERDFEEAEKKLQKMREGMNNIQGPLADKIKSEINSLEGSIKIAKIVMDLEKLTTVDELAKQLQILSSIPSEDGKVVKEQIMNRIVQLSIEDAEKELENRQFTRALAIADRGLQYALNDERLLAFKEKVQLDQQAFEQAEIERIERAKEAAAQEELKNRTAAVEVVSFEAEMDEFKGLVVSGEIKNVATADISSITVSYKILDKNRKEIEERSTTVFPYTLSPGETGKFEDYYFDVDDEVTVEIDNITWFVE
ncbi:FxLYD domain-containing protein [Sutcliffiella cohnii]|uniref:FxLYD domain-containing protein n=1 Tax=Sutcliffiella cohnii TaxID=33932 RepID=UPI002E24F6B8|nr:FxLYD domain-containing protein [Sutcliffiella cohnii]